MAAASSSFQDAPDRGRWIAHFFVPDFRRAPGTAEGLIAPLHQDQLLGTAGDRWVDTAPIGLGKIPPKPTESVRTAVYLEDHVHDGRVAVRIRIVSAPTTATTSPRTNPALLAIWTATAKCSISAPPYALRLHVWVTHIPLPSSDFLPAYTSILRISNCHGTWPPCRQEGRCSTKLTMRTVPTS